MSEGVCPHCGYCKHCGHTPSPEMPPWPAPLYPMPQPYRFDGSWICVCGQRVYSMQVHNCPLRIGPTWTSTGMMLSGTNS
jgi:hypothetical protein